MAFVKDPNCKGVIPNGIEGQIQDTPWVSICFDGFREVASPSALSRLSFTSGLGPGPRSYFQWLVSSQSFATLSPNEVVFANEVLASQQQNMFRVVVSGRQVMHPSMIGIVHKFVPSRSNRRSFIVSGHGVFRICDLSAPVLPKRTKIIFALRHCSRVIGPRRWIFFDTGT